MADYLDLEHLEIEDEEGNTEYYKIKDSEALHGDITDAEEATAINNDDENIITARAVYYGTPNFNDSHDYDSDTTFYAPTEPGNNGQVLTSNGSGEPSWSTIDASGTITNPEPIIYYAISSDDSTTDKNVDIDDFSLIIGSLMIVTFESEVNPGCTLNVSSTGAIPLYHLGKPIRYNQIQEGATAVFLFDGAHYILLSTDTEAGSDYIYADEDTSGNSIQPSNVTSISDKIATLASSDTSGTYNVYYGTSEDNSGSAKTADIDGFELEVASLVMVTFASAADAGCTLNISDTGATPIYHMGSPIKRYVIQEGATCMLVYDGTDYLLLSCDTEAGSDYIEEDPLLDIDFGRVDEYNASNGGGVTDPEPEPEPEPDPSAIGITATTDATSYEAESEIDKSTIVVKLVYDNDDTETLSEDEFDISPTIAPSQTGEFELTVTDKEYNFSDTITLKVVVGFAIYSNTDNSLTFYSDTAVPTGSTYNNKNATNIYSGFENEQYSSESEVAWYSVRESVASVVFDESYKCIRPISTAHWFRYFENMTSCDLTGLNTSKVIDMQYMFYHCESVTGLDVSNFDTSNVTNMAQMLSYLCKVASLDLSNFNTSKVTAMNGMFRGTGDTQPGFVTLDLSGWDLSNVELINAMFRENSNLKTIYVDKDWDLSSVTNDANMFIECPNLVGGNGTAYDSDKVDGSMCHIDTSSNPGYFTDVKNKS